MVGPPPRLSISIVTFQPAIEMLRQTLESLSLAITRAQAEAKLGETRLEILDNGTHQPDELAALASRFGAQLRRGQGNIGYGCAHNLSLLTSDCHFHLVLNPDVVLNRDALIVALDYMQGQPEVVILAPKVRSQDGGAQHLCKNYPSVLTLALRGFAPQWLRRHFEPQLRDYALFDLPLDTPTKGIPLLSGSFMFCRRAPIASIGGFSHQFFLYFEDFDLSLRATRVGQLAYVPGVEILHFGGNAAAKGWRHRRLFIQGAITFFRQHGWKWL